MAHTIIGGEVTIVLAGQNHALSPTLEAFTRIAALGPYGETVRACLGGDVNAMAAVARAGLGWPVRDAQRVTELIYQTGVTPLGGQLAEYVYRLFNGGRNAEEVAAEMRATEGGEGKEPRTA